MVEKTRGGLWSAPYFQEGKSMKAHYRPRMMMIVLSLTILSLLGLTACSTDSATRAGSQGEIKMYMVDAPSDYDAVNIVVTEVSVHMTSSDTVSGWMVINDTTRTINLLSLTNGNVDILGSGGLDVGSYSQIRLKIGTGSNVVVNGQTHSLDIPSGDQTGLKLNHAFNITSRALYELTLDFDASRSIHVTGNDQYQMRPVIRVMANVVSGSISGIVVPVAAMAHVSTMMGSDSMTTYTNMMSGSFMLMALPAGMCSVTINSGVDLYADTTITGVTVVARQNTNLGQIVLRLR